MIQTIKKAWAIPELRKKIVFTALILLIFRLLVLRGDVHALHDELAALRVSRQDFAFLALVLTGDHNHRILGTDMHILLPLLTELREPETRSS